MSVLLFLLILFVLVLVHELGHFMVAKWTGMRVDEFGIGFPPKLFGIKKGETEYTFNLFPVGGFVKIYGEDGGEDKEGTPLGTTTTINRSSGSFVSKSKWAQAAVLIAGVTMNVLFAWILVTIAFMIGVQTIVSKEEATEHAKLTITSVLEGSPADEAGIEAGSVIRGVVSNGEELSDFSAEGLSTFIQSRGTEPVMLMYEREGELKMVALTPETGLIEGKNGEPAIGVALGLFDTLPRGFVDASVEGGKYVVEGLMQITVGIFTLVKNALMFAADFSQVAGPIGIVGLVGEASAYGVASLLMFTAFISLNLAVINILPFPALDGGRLLFVAIEAVKGSPLPQRFAATLNMVGFFILILLMVAVTWNDIARIG